MALNRGKVDALNGPMVAELRRRFEELEADPQVRAVVLTGRGRFFSFGFDVPELLSVSKEDSKVYVTAFTGLYTCLFLYPKPVVAALNGHAVAGGCMLALACDSRVMASGKARISLNEIGFGSSVFAGSTEMLRFLGSSPGAPPRRRSHLGAMLPAEEARSLGLVEEVEPPEAVLDRATRCRLGSGVPAREHVHENQGPPGDRAPSGVQFELGPGVTGLLGPNGAAKTTLLRLLTGLLTPTRWQILFRGVPVDAESLPTFRHHLGSLPQEFDAYPHARPPALERPRLSRSPGPPRLAPKG